MKQNRRSINKTLTALRKIINNTDDDKVAVLAYFAECCIRWAVEDTVDWQRPEQDVFLHADKLR